LLDAYGAHTFDAFNYSVPETHSTGYVVVAAHTRAPLLKEIRKGGLLPNLVGQRVCYLSEGEFHFEDGGYWRLLSGDKVAGRQLDELWQNRQESLRRTPRALLDSIEVETTAMLNNIKYLTTTDS
jgi:hypothetical protein